jgi:hypothetical protein
MMSSAAARGGSSDVMETASMTPTFIARLEREVKAENRAATQRRIFPFYGRLSARNQNL